MLNEEVFESRRKIVVEAIKNIKRKRPIQNQRLDSFSWWIWVEKEIQDEMFKVLDKQSKEIISLVKKKAKLKYGLKGIKNKSYEDF